MAQQTVLLSLPHVTVYQLTPIASASSDPFNDRPADDSQSILFPSTTLNLLLLDIPSNTLKSIPSSSDPPSYNDLPKQDPSNQSVSPTVETWPVISLADGLIEIPLSRSSHITCPSPHIYLIPILPIDHDLGKKSEDPALIKLEIANDVSNETLETLDSILSSWAHFSPPPASNFDQPSQQTPLKSLPRPPPSHPSTTSSSTNSIPTQSTSTLLPAHQNDDHSKPSFPSEGRLALIDESTGEICGELDSDVKLQGPHVSHHSPPYPPGPPNLVPTPGQHLPHQPLLAAPQPVIVNLISSTSSSPYPTTAEVTPLPVNDRSQILEGAEWISRGILAGSEVISAMITRSGNSYLSSSKPAAVPMTFSSTTHSSVDKVLGFTRTASKVSGKTAAMVGTIFGKVGDSIGKTAGIQRAPNGALPTGTRGYVHKGLLACNTVFNSLETGAKKVISTAGDTTTNVVTHAYGPEAGQIAQRSNDVVRNVGLVYIDARGVTRRAILKSVGKAAIKGRMNDGREVIFGSDEKVDDWIKVDSQAAGPCQSKIADPSQSNKPVGTS